MPGWEPWTVFAVALVLALVVAVVVAAAVAWPIRLLAQRAGWDSSLVGKIRRPFRILLLVVGVWIAVSVSLPVEVPGMVRLGVQQFLRVASFAAGGWLLVGVVAFLFARALARYPTDVADNRVARRVHTQVTILRRVATVLIVIVTLGAILLTFQGVQAIGASLLASAGLASVIAGLAAQSTLSNVFAGLQLAFSDAIRVDDVVVVDTQWGRIEEITLTYIVVRIWDDRRLVLPSTYFTTTPFENWTRSGSELLGSIELDLDWRVSPAQMRTRLEEVLEAEPLWDRRSSVLQVTDAIGGYVRVRILVTAANSGALWDLRCKVREAMVEWLHEKSPASLPRTRVQLVEQEHRATGPAHTQDEGLFSGSPEAEERGRQLTQGTPDPVDGPPASTDP